jgi:hypothetical protein
MSEDPNHAVLEFVDQFLKGLAVVFADAEHQADVRVAESEGLTGAADRFHGDPELCAGDGQVTASRYQ